MISKCVSVCVCLSLSHTSFSLSISHRKTSIQRAFTLYFFLSTDRGSSHAAKAATLREYERVEVKQLNQNSLGKGKGVCLTAKVSTERPENFCFCLDHPGQITLLEVCLPELRGQALPLTFQRGVICKYTVIWKVHCEKCQGAALSILWRAQLGASSKTKQLRDWWSGMHR